MKRHLLLGLSLGLILVAVAFSQDQVPNKPATSDAGPAPAMGQELFAQKCAVCHKTDSEDKTVGPGLKGLSARNFVTTNEPVTDEAIKKWILKGDGRMPPFENKLSSDQVDSLVVYLKTL